MAPAEIVDSDAGREEDRDEEREQAQDAAQAVPDSPAADEDAFDVQGAPGPAAPAPDDDAGEQAREKQRRALLEENMENARAREAQSGLRAGFTAAAGAGAAAGASSDHDGGAFDLTGKFFLKPEWLKNPKKHIGEINRRLDNVIEKALDNEWKYISVTRYGKVESTAAMLLQNRIAHLALHPKEADRVLTRMGYTTPEERSEARARLQGMVVMHQAVDMKMFRQAAASSSSASSSSPPSSSSEAPSSASAARAGPDGLDRLRENAADMTAASAGAPPPAATVSSGFRRLFSPGMG